MTEVLAQQRVWVPTLAHKKFLREVLRWSGAATPREIGQKTSQEENSCRQTCKRRGWVEFDGYYWRLTDAGRQALKAANAHESC